MASLSLEDTRLVLDRGEIVVAFHPERRGQEHLSVETPTARVEVVGTVFTVSVEPSGSTTVAVREGTVRVVPVAGRASLVHAGESRRVEAIVAGNAEESAANSIADDNSSIFAEISEEITGPGLASATDSQARSGAASPPSRPAARHLARGAAATERSGEAQAEIEERLREARRQLVHGNHAEARASLSEIARGASPAPLRAEAFTLLAESRAATGELEGAVAAYRSAAEIGQGRLAGHNALYALARLEERRLHDREGAVAAYRAYLREAPSGALAAQARRALCRLGEQSECAPTGD